MRWLAYVYFEAWAANIAKLPDYCVDNGEFRRACWGVRGQALLVEPTPVGNRSGCQTPHSIIIAQTSGTVFDLPQSDRGPRNDPHLRCRTQLAEPPFAGLSDFSPFTFQAVADTIWPT